MNTVYVTNKSDKTLVDEYAYKTIKFPVNEPVEVPVEVARHIFGYMQMDKTPAMVRLGLVITTNDLEAGLQRLAKFEITEDKPQQDRFLSPGDDLVTPLVPRAQVGRKVVNAA